MNVFGRYVRLRRLRAGLGLRHVARALGLSHVYLGEVERADRPPLDRRHWPGLTQAVSGVTLEALEWAAASAGPLLVDLTSLGQRERFAALAAVRAELPEEPLELQEEVLDRLRSPDDPGIVDAIMAVLGDENLTSAEITDTLIALGWAPCASDLTQRVNYFLHQHRDQFVRVGEWYRRR